MVGRERSASYGVGGTDSLRHTTGVYTNTHAVVDIWPATRYSARMAKIRMNSDSRFGNMFAQAVERKGMSLRDVAQKTDYSYEQMRKLLKGSSAPSKLLVKDLSKILDMDFAKAEQAATEDRMQRRYGPKGLKALGRDPRLVPLDAVASVLTDRELQILLAVAHSLVKTRKQA